MRLFVAIEIPPSVREALAAIRSAEGARFPAARWVRPENIHLTLDFLGEQVDAMLPSVESVLAGTAMEFSSLRLTVDGPGTFPASRPARVAWVGLRASDELLSLQSAIGRRLDGPLGREASSRRFHPHLTMARPRSPWGRGHAERWCELPIPCSGETFQVTCVDLMQSHLSPSGPTYDRLRRFSLEG